MRRKWIKTSELALTREAGFSDRELLVAAASLLSKGLDYPYTAAQLAREIMLRTRYTQVSKPHTSKVGEVLRLLSKRERSRRKGEGWDKEDQCFWDNHLCFLLGDDPELAQALKEIAISKQVEEERGD